MEQRRVKLLALICLGIFVSGCLVSSINPLYTSKSIKYNKKLIGSWAGEENTFLFERHGKEKAYDMTISDDQGNRSKLLARLVKLGKYQFLDLTAANKDTAELGMFGLLHFFKEKPTHSFMKFNLDGKQLILKMLSWGWVSKKVLAGEFPLDHVVAKMETEENETEEAPDDLLEGITQEAMEEAISQQAPIVITASTKDLREFILQHADNNEAFGEIVFELSRQ